MDRRKREHLRVLKHAKHTNGRLQNNYNKYGESSLVFYIVEYCNIDSLTHREQFYYDYFKDILHRDMCNFSDFVDQPTRIRDSVKIAERAGARQITELILKFQEDPNQDRPFPKLLDLLAELRTKGLPR